MRPEQQMLFPPAMESEFSKEQRKQIDAAREHYFLGLALEEYGTFDQSVNPKFVGFTLRYGDKGAYPVFKTDNGCFAVDDHRPGSVVSWRVDENNIIVESLVDYEK